MHAGFTYSGIRVDMAMSCTRACIRVYWRPKTHERGEKGNVVQPRQQLFLHSSGESPRSRRDPQVSSSSTTSTYASLPAYDFHYFTPKKKTRLVINKFEYAVLPALAEMSDKVL